MKRKNTHREQEKMLPVMNNYVSRKDWERACWRRMMESEKLLHALTTPSERHNMVMRAAATEALQSGKSYRQISKELGISLQTINSIKRAADRNGYRSYFERSKKEGRKKRFNTKPITSTKPRREGRRQRTKYGIVYLP